METFIVHLESFDNNHIDWTTQLTIEANNRNEAIVKAMNWLTKQGLTVNTVRVDY